MNLTEISKFITSHGGWALLAVALSALNLWLLKQLISAWADRLKDLKETIPVMQEVRTAMDIQAKLLENFIQEMRSKK